MRGQLTFKAKASERSCRTGSELKIYHMCTKSQVPQLPIVEFKSPRAFRRWLAKNHDQSDGIWLRIYNKGFDQLSITYAQALDQALCFGWIDGQKQKGDRDSWLQKFTSRRAGSGWSKINTKHAERLIEVGVMTPSGLNAIEAAKLDGRRDAAYELSPRRLDQQVDPANPRRISRGQRD
jgi:uncharacterized protein YdeI (YjbR/CyaY-like superfamily)